MLEKQFYCTYRDHKGDIITEVIMAVSENAANRIVMLKHPLAEIQRTTTEAPKPIPTTKAKKGWMSKAVIGLIGVCVILVCIVLKLMLRLDSVADNKKNAEETNDVVNQDVSKDQYVKAYQHLVSIRTDDASGTGFRAKIGNKIYLYTCFHCIRHSSSIVAKDSVGKRLVLGDLELCYDRDLVRFELPEETEGLELANKEEVCVSADVFGYGDTLGGGVMTQNMGKILAVGAQKIEIDAAVLQGNSGGPVVNEAGRVIGIISSGSVDDTIWAKGTRYENVRKFAERADGGEWECVSYEDFRSVYSFICDTYFMTCELREFSSKVSGLQFSQRIVRPFANNQYYKGDSGYVEEIKGLYDAWNEMADVEDERQKLWDKTNGKVGTMLDENKYYEVVKKRNGLQRRSCVSLPLRMLTFAADELKSIEEPYFAKARQVLLKDIEEVLIPAFNDDSKFSDRLEKQAYEAYQHDYKKAR